MNGETVVKILLQERVVSKATILEDTEKHTILEVNEHGKSYSSTFKVDKNRMEVMRQLRNSYSGMNQWYHVTFIPKFLTDNLISGDEAIKDLFRN
ncbi:hypothetical protein [Alkalihalobacillus sp. BA299]|uniref:hypothetical protein n=1 Tax=Alkalihalobacillus sp. BA299 TaxID=2815938 RepID=UPI001AD9E7B9|nr:hypothetical protein [Alkalihalobacillus sp. BA299]